MGRPGRSIQPARERRWLDRVVAPESYARQHGGRSSLTEATMEPMPPNHRPRRIANVRDYDPTPPPADLVARHGVRVLDPTNALQLPGIPTRSTVYFPDHLLVPGDVDIAAVLSLLDAVAAELGLKAQPDERPRPLSHDPSAVRLLPRGDDALAPPDAWTVLQRARARFGVENVKGVGLDHLLVTNGRIISVPWQPRFEPAELDPVPSTPQPPGHPSTPLIDSQKSPAPPSGVPWTALPDPAQITDYVQQGSGGRQPIAQLGPPPPRTPHL